MGIVERERTHSNVAAPLTWHIFVKVLNLSHPTIDTRDLATYFPFCVGLRPDA